jgi:4-hydroxy 2-oxovalerate aldolase
MNVLDCTLRDGGYYNSWNFESGLVQAYLNAMDALQVNYVEIGLRSLKNHGFKGAFAYSTDGFLKRLDIPSYLQNKIGVMINASELVGESSGMVEILEQLFQPKEESVVSLVRIACHVHEFEDALPAANWLKNKGYLVGFNLMQIADHSDQEIIRLATLASDYSIDVLYFADSMGSLNPDGVRHIVGLIRQGWLGAIGIHTHDNMNCALANSVAAVEVGVNWVDATVTGMGRGPGNAQTEYVFLTLSKYRKHEGNITKLLELIRKYFKPMQNRYGWGTNPFYYLAGQYGIHPSYIQEMLQDSRYSEEDILAVIEHLRIEGGKRFSLNTLEAARHFYSGDPGGNWQPSKLLKNRTVLILGTGPGVKKYKESIEAFIETNKPYVIALNTQSNVRQEFIDVRAACHPVRLLADCKEHLNLPQPLITPANMLPEDIKSELAAKELLDFGILINHEGFEFHSNYAEIPTSLVMAYALAVANSGQANRIYIAGFDGYADGDPRNDESNSIIKQYMMSDNPVELISITPTRYVVKQQSIFGVLEEQ